MIQGTNVGVFTVGKSKAQVDAGVKFIQYLIKDKWTIYWAKKTGYIPVRESALDSEEWQSYLEENPKRKAMTQMMREGFVYPHHLKWNVVRNILGNVLEKTMLNKGNPEDLLKEGVKTFEKKTG